MHEEVPERRRILPRVLHLRDAEVLVDTDDDRRITRSRLPQPQRLVDAGQLDLDPAAHRPIAHEPLVHRTGLVPDPGTLHRRGPRDHESRLIHGQFVRQGQRLEVGLLDVNPQRNGVTPKRALDHQAHVHDLGRRSIGRDGQRRRARCPKLDMVLAGHLEGQLYLLGINRPPVAEAIPKDDRLVGLDDPVRIPLGFHGCAAPVENLLQLDAQHRGTL